MGLYENIMKVIVMAIISMKILHSDDKYLYLM